MNRLLQQFTRDGHLTFIKKRRELVVKIFGDEGLYDKDTLAEVATCTLFDIDFFSLDKLKYKDVVAWRKLVNPFKWAEFIITAPLELLTWRFCRILTDINSYINHHAPNLAVKLLLCLLYCVVSILHTFINLAVNLLTGTIRRFLAPVRYIIRPSIELAKTLPSIFLMVLGLTVIGTAILTAFTFSGAIPVLSSLVLAGSLGIKISTVIGIKAACFATLLKCATAIPDIWDGMKRLCRKSDLERQFGRVNSLNRVNGYPIYFMVVVIPPTIEELNENYQQKFPMIIKCGGEFYIYWNDSKQNKKLQLHKIGLPPPFLIAFSNHNIERLRNKQSSSPDELMIDIPIVAEKVTESMYRYLSISHLYHAKPPSRNVVKSNDPASTTPQISNTNHAMDPTVFKGMRQIKNQGFCHCTALFFGFGGLGSPMKPKESFHNWNMKATR